MESIYIKIASNSPGPNPGPSRKNTKDEIATGAQKKNQSLTVTVLVPACSPRRPFRRTQDPAQLPEPGTTYKERPHHAPPSSARGGGGRWGGEEGARQSVRRPHHAANRTWHTTMAVLVLARQHRTGLPTYPQHCVTIHRLPFFCFVF